MKLFSRLTPWPLFLAMGLLTSSTALAAPEVKFQTGFETEAQRNWTADGGAAVDSQEHHGGSYSLRIARGHDADPASWISPSFAVKGGETYKFSAWMKATKIFMPDPSFAPEAHVIFLNALYAQVGEVSFADYWKVPKPDDGAVGINTFNFDWNYFEKDVTAPPSAGEAEIQFQFAKTTGTAWLDDVEVTYDPDATSATSGNGPAAQTGFLRLWPSRLGESPAWGMRSADGTLFNPGEPVSFYVAPPAGAGGPATISWKLKDALQRSLEGDSVPVTGPGLQRITLPNLDAQAGRWLECDLAFCAGDKVLATRKISLGVCAAQGPADPSDFGSTGNPDQYGFTARLGVQYIRSDIFWRDDIQPTKEAPVTWQGLFDQRMALPATHGFKNLALWSYQSPKWARLRPDGLHDGSMGYPCQPDALKAAVIQTVAKYKGAVSYWQLGNEVNLHEPALLSDYLLDLKAFSEGVRAADPTAKVVMGSQNRGLDDIQAAIDQGALNYVDIIDTHYFDAGSLKSLRAMLDKASPNKKIEMWQTEAGMFTQDSDDIYAITLEKMFTQYQSAGVTNTIWCYLGGTPSLSEREEESPDQVRGDYLTAYTEMPGQLFFAHLLTASFIQGLDPTAEFNWGTRGHGYYFHHGDRNALVVWADGLEPLAGALTLPAAQVESGDWTGRLAAMTSGGHPLPVVLSQRPWFYRWTGPVAPNAGISFAATAPIQLASKRSRVLYKGTDNVIAVTAAPGGPVWTLTFDAGPGVTVTPASLKLVPGTTKTVTVTVPRDISAERLTLDVHAATGDATAWTSYEYNLRPALVASLETVPRANRLAASQVPAWKLVIANNGSRSEAANVDFCSLATTGFRPDEWKRSLTVAAGGTKELLFPVSTPPSFDRLYGARASIRIGGDTIALDESHGFLGVVKLKRPPLINGDMSQWSQVIPCTLDKAENYWRYRDDGVVWKGPADLSAQLRFGWDDAAFYLAADVSDDIHVNNQDPANIWNGDSLEFALQPVDEFDHNPITKVILALARGTSCIMGVQTKHAGPLPLAGATVLVTRGTGHTFYQARLPWSELFPGRLAPTAGSHLRTAAMLNEDDGTGRNAYMCWFGRLTYPTLGETMFTDMTLLNG